MGGAAWDISGSKCFDPVDRIDRSVSCGVCDHRFTPGDDVSAHMVLHVAEMIERDNDRSDRAREQASAQVAGLQALLGELRDDG